VAASQEYVNTYATRRRETLCISSGPLEAAIAENAMSGIMERNVCVLVCVVVCVVVCVWLRVWLCACLSVCGVC